MRTASIVVMMSLLTVAACGGGGNDNESPRALVGAGTYDATVEHEGASFEDVGSVYVQRDHIGLSLQLGPDAGVQFSGRLNDESTVQGTGLLFVTDVGYQADVEATFSTDGDAYVVSGSAVAPDALRGFDRPLTFTMRRPMHADASGFSGSYRFTFDPGPRCTCTSTIDFDFTIDAQGNGSAGDTTEYASDGTVLTAIGFPRLTLSPQGKLRISSGYSPVDGTMPEYLTLVGTLDASASPTTASGDTLLGLFSPSGPFGTWTAERLP